ncbi:MAG: HEPN domain-containing protein [Saprospiraceae bacterium]|nr:HEPN domain-containing protein [Saprospiraceae bacterium]
MTKSEYIDYWKTIAEKDWTAVNHLFEKGDYLHSLFFAHLVLEKLLKAHWIKDNPSDVPPKTHNLLFLCSQTNLKPDVDTLRLLSQVNQFQLDGRYPDYKLNMYKIADELYTKSLLAEIKNAKSWLESVL